VSSPPNSGYYRDHGIRSAKVDLSELHRQVFADGHFAAFPSMPVLSLDGPQRDRRLFVFKQPLSPGKARFGKRLFVTFEDIGAWGTTISEGGDPLPVW
jgi:hypothetical protein